MAGTGTEFASLIVGWEVQRDPPWALTPFRRGWGGAQQREGAEMCWEGNAPQVGCRLLLFVPAESLYPCCVARFALQLETCLTIKAIKSPWGWGRWKTPFPSAGSWRVKADINELCKPIGEGRNSLRSVRFASPRDSLLHYIQVLVLRPSPWSLTMLSNVTSTSQMGLVLSPFFPAYNSPFGEVAECGPGLTPLRALGMLIAWVKPCCVWGRRNEAEHGS